MMGTSRCRHPISEVSHYARLRIDLCGDPVEQVYRRKSIRLTVQASPTTGCNRPGSYPIKPGIPGLDLLEVQSCWSMDDARRIMAHAAPDSRVLQIGAGFIGASSCRRR
jgi:hypothetical protein